MLDGGPIVRGCSGMVAEDFVRREVGRWGSNLE